MLPSGFTLIGNDVKLNSPSSLIGQALTEILQHPERARDALRVLLHLVRADGTLWGTSWEGQHKTWWPDPSSYLEEGKMVTLEGLWVDWQERVPGWQ